ncbi:hypothetical protein [Kaistia sp. MMO-174]|uniref:hypothetical protein n=1 Tax=Kaistia sp. MMO-174 TaxID=3081256 RepID=UPI0030168113
MRLIILSVTAASVLAGCQSTDFMTANYKGIEPISYTVLPEGPRYVANASTGTTEDRARVYEIFDNPSESKLLITATKSTAIMSGVAAGVIGYGVSTDAPPVAYRDAAEAWLASQNRKCTARDTTSVAKAAYEVRYSCEQPPQPKT